MKTAIIASGSRGDVQPYIALGASLQQAGHSVQLLSSTDFQTLITSHNLTFVETSGSAETAARTQITDLLDGGKKLKVLLETGRGAQQLARQTATIALAACADADLIISGLGGFAVGLALAQKLNIPFVPAYLVPFMPTRRYPSALAPLPQTPLTAWANSLTHHITRQMVWQMFRQSDKTARTEVLGLPPSPFFGPFATMQQQPTLFGYSRHVLPPDPGWPASVQVTGYWFLDEPAGWQPPAQLVEFLQAGPPPIYIGFGSMPSKDPRATADLVLQALARSGQRGILYAGWGGLQASDLPDSVLMIAATPHSWLFPRMAAVVHHGGAGTTAAGLRAGVPAIVTPFFGDQPFWGGQIYRLGIGPKPLPRRRLTADALAAAMHRAVSDAEMQARAAALGARIRAEDGAATAAAIITQQFG